MPLVERFSQQRWIPYRFRRSVLKRIAPGFLRQHQFEADFIGGLRFRGNLVDYIERLIYFCGAHEKFMLAFFRDVSARLKEELKTPLVYIDVGANAGNHAIYLATQVAHVHAFEPFPRVRERLEENIALNGLQNITIHPVGLGEKDEELPFFAPPDANQGAGSFHGDFKEYNTAYGTLKVVNGDRYAEAHGIGAFHLLKADIEGFERFALAGLAASIRKHRPLMIIELSDKTRSTFGGAAEFIGSFPENYRFFMFAKADLEHGAYKLVPFDYDGKMLGQDVVCCPAEWVELLPLSGKL